MGWIPTTTVTYTSTRSSPIEWALIIGWLLQEVYDTATAISPYTFIKFYKVSFAPSSSVSGMAISEHVSGQSYGESSSSWHCCWWLGGMKYHASYIQYVTLVLWMPVPIIGLKRRFRLFYRGKDIYCKYYIIHHYRKVFECIHMHRRCISHLVVSMQAFIHRNTVTLHTVCN